MANNGNGIRWRWGCVGRPPATRAQLPPRHRDGGGGFWTLVSREFRRVIRPVNRRGFSADLRRICAVKTDARTAETQWTQRGRAATDGARPSRPQRQHRSRRAENFWRCRGCGAAAGGTPARLNPRGARGFFMPRPPCPPVQHLPIPLPQIHLPNSTFPPQDGGARRTKAVRIFHALLPLPRCDRSPVALRLGCGCAAPCSSRLGGQKFGATG